MPDEITAPVVPTEAPAASETAAPAATETTEAPAPQTEEAKVPEVPKTEEVTEPQIRSRMTKQDFIIARKDAKIAKMEAEKQTVPDPEYDEPEEEDEIAPQNEEAISKVVAKQYAPIIEKHMQEQDAQEVASFVKDNPDFAPFEAQVKKFMQHESRRHLPIKTLFYEVAGDKLLQLGAERARKADAEAKQTQSGGGSNRGGMAPKSVTEMTPEEFEAKQLEVLTRKH